MSRRNSILRITFDGRVGTRHGSRLRHGSCDGRAFAEAGASVVLADCERGGGTLRGRGTDGQPGTRLSPSAATSPTTPRSRRWSSRPSPRSAGWMRPSTTRAFRARVAEMADAATRRVRPGHGRQPPRRLELHEVRAAADAKAGERGHRQQLVDRRAHRRSPGGRRTTPRSTACSGSPRVRRSSTPRVASASTPSARASSRRRWSRRCWPRSRRRWKAS